MISSYTEDHLVEQPAIQLMQHELGWEVVYAFGEYSSQKTKSTNNRQLISSPL